LADKTEIPLLASTLCVQCGATKIGRTVHL